MSNNPLQPSTIGQSEAIPRLSWAEVCTRRLERHALSAPLSTPLWDTRPADIVRSMCGAHAQILSAAELSIGIRMAGITRTDVQEALWTEHSLIKTYGPRGTVHLLSAADLPMWTGALSETMEYPSGFPEGALLTPEETEKVIEGIAIILEDAELTADELTEALVNHVGAWAGEMAEGGFLQMWPRWRQAIYLAGIRGALCFAPNKGRKVAYTNPRRWLPDFQPADGQAALAEVVKHYLHAYGPATPQQFAQWLAAPRGRATKLFESLSSELQPVEVDGVLAWQVAGDTKAVSAKPDGVRLLPYFDAYMVGCHPRERVFPGRAAERALSNGQAGNFPVVLVDGVVAGVWHMKRSGRKMNIIVEPFDPLTAPQRRELNDQVARIGEFFEGNPQLTIGTVAAGGHL
jgi:hypothetical protein